MALTCCHILSVTSWSWWLSSAPHPTLGWWYLREPGVTKGAWTDGYTRESLSLQLELGPVCSTPRGWMLQDHSSALLTPSGVIKEEHVPPSSPQSSYPQGHDILLWFRFTSFCQRREMKSLWVTKSVFFSFFLFKCLDIILWLVFRLLNTFSLYYITLKVLQTLVSTCSLKASEFKKRSSGNSDMFSEKKSLWPRFSLLASTLRFVLFIEPK